MVTILKIYFPIVICNVYNVLYYCVLYIVHCVIFYSIVYCIFYIVCTIDAIGLLVKLHGEAYMQVLDQIVPPYLNKFLTSGSFALSGFAIDLLSDIFEYGGSNATPYISIYLPQLVSGLTDSTDEDVRQSCSFAILQVVRHHADVTVAFMGEFLQKLHAVVSADGARNRNEGVFENLCCCLGMFSAIPAYSGAIAAANKESFDLLVKMWLFSMPLLYCPVNKLR